MNPSSYRLAFPLVFAFAITAPACASAPGTDEVTDAVETETVGETKQEICFKCDRTKLGGRGGPATIIEDPVLAPPDPPQAGEEFQCKPPQYTFRDGQCYIGVPVGNYPLSLYLCPHAYPVLRCDFRGYCTCWTY